MNDIERVVNQNAALEDKVKAVFLELYSIEGNAGDSAVSLLAVELATCIFNVLTNVRKPTAGLNLKATMALTVGLNDNKLWVTNAGRFMPLLHMALNAQADFALLQLEKEAQPNTTIYDKLRHESELVGLEIFVMLYFVIHGSDKTIANSLQVKKKLLPYLAS